MKIGATLPAIAASSPSASQAEKIAEDIAKISELRRVETSGAAGAGQAIVAEGIVAAPLVGIAENTIGFGGEFEFLLRFGVAGILVGMILHRHLAVGALERLLGHRAIHSQHFVIVWF